MKTITKAIMAALLIALSGCRGESEKEESTSNSEFTAQLLFTHEGVKVYRFKDGRRYIYYADARGRTEWTETHSTKHTLETVAEEGVKVYRFKDGRRYIYYAEEGQRDRN